MKADKVTIRIELTPEQREHVRLANGKESRQLWLEPEKLEERIAPGYDLKVNKAW